MCRWSAKEAHVVDSDLFEDRWDEPPRLVGAHRAIGQSGRNGEMGIRRTAQAHVCLPAISRIRMAVR